MSLLGDVGFANNEVSMPGLSSTESDDENATTQGRIFRSVP